MIELSDDTDARCEEKAKEKEKAIEDDRKKGIKYSKHTAMERFGETRKRKNKEEDENPKTSRRSSSDTLTFLREKMELDKENHRIEREEKAAERMEVQRCRSSSMHCYLNRHKF